MKIRLFVCSAIVVGLMALPAAAQQGRPGRPSPSATPIQARAPIMSVPSTTRPTLATGSLNSQDWDQTGWSAMTQGQSQGAPSVLRLGNGQTWLVVRAEDSQLYGAPINSAQPGLIASAAWRAFGMVAQSEPDCQPIVPSTPADGFGWGERMLCAYLSSGGAAEVSLLSTGTGAITTFPLGGRNAGARPTILPRALGSSVATPGGSYASSTVAATAVVWDGASSIYRGAFTVGVSTGASPNQVPTWEQVTTVGGPVGCAFRTNVQPCAWTAASQIVVRDNPAFTGAALTTSAVPGGTDRRTAPAVVVTSSGRVVIAVRNAMGRIYWTTRPAGSGAFSAWQDAGGVARNRTGLSCIGEGESVSCFIQGWDGRIFGRVIGNTANL